MAYDFDGTDDRIDFTAPQTLGASAFSLSFWFQADDASPSTSQYPFNAGHSTNFGTLAFLTTGSKMRFWVSNTGGTSFSDRTSSANFSTSGWQHFLGTWDGNSGGSGMHIYTNGSLDDGAAAGSGSVRASNDDWVIGGRQSDNTRNLDGRVAEVAVWDVELSAADAASLADAFSPLLVRPGSLIFYPNLIRGRQDIISGAVGSLASAPSVFAHPRIIYPRRRSLVSVPAPAAGGATPKGPLGQLVFAGPLGGPI